MNLKPLIIKPLSIGANHTSTPDDVDNARYLYCANTVSKTNSNGTRFVAIRSAGGTLKSTIMVGANETIIIEKDRTDKVSGTTGPAGALLGNSANGNVVFTKIAINGQT